MSPVWMKRNDFKVKLLPCRSGGDPRDLIENGMHCCPNAKGEIQLVAALRRFSWPVFERLQRFSGAAPPQEAGGVLVARTLPSRLSFSASFLIFCANRALLGRGVKGRAWWQLDFQPISTSAPFAAAARTRGQWRRPALHPNLEGETCFGCERSKPSRTCAPNSSHSPGATTKPGSSHGMDTQRPARLREEQTVPRIVIDPLLAATLPLAA